MKTSKTNHADLRRLKRQVEVLEKLEKSEEERVHNVWKLMNRCYYNRYSVENERMRRLIVNLPLPIISPKLKDISLEGLEALAFKASSFERYEGGVANTETKTFLMLSFPHITLTPNKHYILEGVITGSLREVHHYYGGKLPCTASEYHSRVAKSICDCKEFCKIVSPESEVFPLYKEKSGNEPAR